MEEIEINRKNATHLLICHYGNRFTKKKYYMNCLPLKETEQGKVKIVVFGKRTNCLVGTKKVRYVEKEKVIRKQMSLFF